MESDNMERDNYILGMDIGGTKSAVLLARTGRKKTDGIEFLERCAVPTKGSWQEVLGILALRGGEMVKRHGILGLPARIKIDADACALAVWRYGAGLGCRHMIFLTFGTGLGAGLILNGRLYQGACGMAGEAGHIRLDQDGPVGYGKAGSFEGFCSGGGIAQLARRMAAEALKEGKNVSYSGKKGLDFITAKDVAEAAECGMEDALQVYGCSGRYFGRGLAVLIDILNPERIVVGSIFARSGKLMREETEKELRKEALPESLAACTIVPAALGDRIGDYGAVVAALE